MNAATQHAMNQAGTSTTKYPKTTCNMKKHMTPIMNNTTSSTSLRICGLTTLSAVALLLSACGDSDLPDLQRDAIVAAQQRIQVAQAALENQPDSAEANEGGEGSEDSVENEEIIETDDTEAAEPESDNANTTEDNIETATEVEAGPPNTIDLSGFELIFNENFDNGEINPDKWSTALRFGPDVIVNDEEQYYVDILNDPEFGYNPFRMDSDTLAIGANVTPEGLVESANNQPFVSGVLSTADRFEFTHGIAEIRAQIPAGTGLYPQFWMLPDEFIGLRPQTFIMEARGDDPSTVFHTYKYQDADDNLQTPGTAQTQGDDFSAGFHTYAVEWSPGELIFYIDGTETHRINSENIASQDMYLIINLAVGGFFAGSPDENTTFPAELIIDHVRVFQLAP